MMKNKLEAISTKWQEFKTDWNNPNNRRVRNKKTSEIFTMIIRTFILTGLCFLILMPIIERISYALRHPTDITNPQVIWIPETFSLENVRIALGYLHYNEAFWNTLTLSTFSMIIQVLATAVAGYAFARLKFPGSNFVFYLVLFTLVVPNEAMYVPRFLWYSNVSFFGVNLIRNVFAIYIMSAFGMGVRSAIFIYLFRQFFRNIPLELEESAEIDGAGVIRTFWSVMLPNARGAIVTVSLFAFVWQWNDYYFAQLFGLEREMYLLTTRLASGTGSLSAVMVTSYGHLLIDLGQEIKDDPLFFGLISNTAALLLMAPLLIGYFFVQKLFVESIERTGITGM